MTTPTISPVPRQNRPKMVMKSFRLPPRVAAAFEERCAADEVNQSDVLRELVEEWLKDD